MAIKTMVKLKITRYNLKGVDDCGSDKSFSFIAGFQGEVTLKSITVVSNKSSPTLQSIILNVTLFPYLISHPPKTPSDSFFSGAPDLAP